MTSLLLSVFTFFLLSSVESLDCTQRYQCSPVTLNYNYADCIDGVCQCLKNFGFDGNATTSNKCSCQSPSSVFWQSGQPFCISYPDAVQFKLDKAQEEFQNHVVQTIYDSLIWPIPVSIIDALNLGVPSFISVLYSHDAIGRVDPVGTFLDFEGLVEYFYGFVHLPVSKVVNIDMQKLFSKGNQTFFKVVITFNNSDPQTGLPTRTFKLAQTGVFTFNSDELIQSVDLIIPNLGASQPFVPAGDFTYAASLCFLILNLSSCNSTHDPAGFYTSFDDCLFHMTAVYPWGSWDNLYFAGNSTICRGVHALLAVSRPHIHCAHTGKTGGGKCIDHLYETYFDENF